MNGQKALIIEDDPEICELLSIHLKDMGIEVECKGDGKSLWKSKVIRAGAIAEFDIPLDGIENLELLTHPTNDGPGSDWALWLDPKLHQAVQ